MGGLSCHSSRACLRVPLWPSHGSETAHAQFPERTLTLVVPFAAGGSTDVVARIVANKMSEDLGQQVIVQNVGGAGGNVGASNVARAAADGYTILMGTVATHALNPLILKTKPYDPEKDFAPVSLLVLVPNVLVVNPQFPAKTVAELVALLKAEPDKYAYASQATARPASVGRTVQEHGGRPPCSISL